MSGCVRGGDGMGGFDMRFGWVCRLLYIPYIEVKGSEGVKEGGGNPIG